jgi:hypothetical protein
VEEHDDRYRIPDFHGSDKVQIGDRPGADTGDDCWGDSDGVFAQRSIDIPRRGSHYRANRRKFLWIRDVRCPE